jgi:hypothetical protein
LSFYKIPLFSNNSSIACNTFIENTHQIVLYESTGVIEIYIQDMEVCTAWNQGRAMIGIQDVNKTKAFMAPGRKASDPPWGSIGMKEVWRFTPAAGSSLFKRAELYNTSGSLISTATAPNAVNGDLELSFPNVCSPLGTSSFVVKSVYAKMDNPGIEISTYDTPHNLRYAVRQPARFISHLLMVCLHSNMLSQVVVLHQVVLLPICTQVITR